MRRLTHHHLFHTKPPTLATMDLKSHYQAAFGNPKSTRPCFPFLPRGACSIRCRYPTSKCRLVRVDRSHRGSIHKRQGRWMTYYLSCLSSGRRVLHLIRSFKTRPIVSLRGMSPLKKKLCIRKEDAYIVLPITFVRHIFNLPCRVGGSMGFLPQHQHDKRS